MKRIHESLERVFQKNRLVFWYDPSGEWTEAFGAFDDATITKLTVAGNEFGTKVRVVRERTPGARFLVYIPAARPADADNWLLDLLLQGYEFRADKASLVLEDVGLPQEFRHIAEEHAAFFKSVKRVQALREQVSKDDQARDIRLKMIAILAGTAAEVDGLVLHFLGAGFEAQASDPVVAALGPAALTIPFWREVERSFGYGAEQPSILDFATTLFRAADPFDTQCPLNPQAKVFFRRWKDSHAASGSFRLWSRKMEKILNIGAALDGVDVKTELDDSDAFEIFDKFTLRRLYQSFVDGGRAPELRAVIQKRRTSFWKEEHKHGYAALEHAVELRELLAAAELTIDSIDTGLARYVASWWRIDQAYRRCVVNLRQYGQVALTEKVAQWAEGAYINSFLLPLTDRWGDHVRKLDAWQCTQLPAQRSFFDTYVQPYRDKGQKVFVIVSDALRYEAAVDFAEQLRVSNRWTAEVDALFGALPTYTQLGMASLLPGGERSIDATNGTVAVDGQSALGTENRAKILNRRGGGKAAALTAEAFLLLNTKTDGRELMRDHDVIYIFHNHIDKVGDSLSTEARAFEAVDEAFGQLNDIIKKIANINGSNMLLTADHGFLFQQDDVESGDMTPLPAGDWTYRDRRFALGKNIGPSAGVQVFTSAALGVGGDWSAAFPLSLGRFPRQGSGKRFVHGGISLQEVVVPVVKIHKARTDDTEQLEVELLRVPPKITTGQLDIAVYQSRPALAKVLPRTLRFGVFAKDGTSLSEVKTVTFDSKETEARLRETTLILAISPASNAFNGQEVELRLEETVPGTNQVVKYKTHPLKIQKPIASDFDD